MKKSETKKMKSITSFKGVLPYKEINKQEKVTLEYVQKVGEIKGHNYVEHIFVLNGGKVRQVRIDSNLRTAKVNAPVKDMFNTIQSNPKLFLALNGGISYNVSDMEINEETQEITLYFGRQGTGCVNGNHTTCLCITAQEEGLDLSEVFVKVFVRVYDEVGKEELVETAIGMNKSESQVDYAEGELAGFHDIFKEHLGELTKAYDWVPNAEERDKLAIKKDPRNLIGTLTLLDIVKHSKTLTGSAKSHPTGIIMGKSKPYSDWLRQVKRGETPTIHALLPMIKELVAFEDEIICNFHRYGAPFSNNGTLSCKEVGEKYLTEQLNLTLNERGAFSTVSGRKPKYIPEVQILSPILSAYRANLEYNAETGEINWIVDPYMLMKVVNKELVDTVVEAYKSHGSKTKNLMCRKSNSGMWDNMFNKVTLAIMQMQKGQAA